MTDILEVNNELSSEIIDGQLNFYWWYSDACMDEDIDSQLDKFDRADDEVAIKVNFNIPDLVMAICEEEIDFIVDALPLLRSKLVDMLSEVDRITDEISNHQ